MAVSVVDPDEILIREHLGGERDAFDVLYRRYFPRLVRLCTRLTRDAAAAEDIAQETLVRAHDHLERFDLGRPMWPWLKTIAKNLLVDHTRSHGPEFPSEEGPVESEHVDHGWTEERDVLVQALSKLPPRQRTAVALRYLEDWDGTQVAEHLGLSSLAFRQILHRAKRKLRTEYRKIAEPAWGAILVPLSWLRRLSQEAALRVRRTSAHPEAVKAFASVTAINLVVVTAAIFGGAGHDAPPSVDRSAPSNIRLPSEVHRSNDHTRASTAEVSRVHRVSTPEVGSSDGHRAGSDASESLPTKVTERGRDVATGVTDPNGDVEQPEDSQITAIAYSPRFSSDHAAYAAGVAACEAPQCPPVLFGTKDGGESWTRLQATGFHGTQILLPPAYGEGDDRIFAIGPLGLEVSEDHGASFHPATTVSPTLGAGSAAISPAFNDGDPTILIGDQSLSQYRDDVKATGPTKPIPGRGPLHPVFSPTYQADGLLLVGGLQLSGTGWAPSVFRCSGEVCSGSPLPLESSSETPRVRLSADFARSGIVYAFATSGIFVSEDQGISFRRLSTPWSAPLRDLAPAEGGRLLAAVRGTPTGAPGELYSSADGGTSWSPVDSHVVAPGVTSIRVWGTHVLAALHGGGIACSADGGVTWAARCPGASAP
jgi:RNA polymerase sigma-70 factor (ECF subfamily)